MFDTLGNNKFQQNCFNLKYNFMIIFNFINEIYEFLNNLDIISLLVYHI
jgi:hypothetical protein